MIETRDPEQVQRARLPFRVIALGLIVSASLLASLTALGSGSISPRTLQALVLEAGPLGMAAYVAGVVVMELLWLPRMWGLIAGGLLFGPLWGALLSLCGDLIGAVLCYLIAGGMGRDWVSGLLARRPRASRVIELLARRRGLVTIAVLRVCPVAHYTLVSYAAGLTGVRWGAYLAGTAIGLVPWSILYPTLGSAAWDPLSPFFFLGLAILAVALLFAIVATRRLLRI